MRVTVVGAGVAGLACAVELAEQGATVDVVDRGDRLGSSCCSWYAGGMLAPWCELANAELMVARLGSESIEWWRRRFPATSRSGSLVVALGRNAGELMQFSRRVERFEWVRGEDIGALEPALTGRFEQALYFKDEGHLDPRAALRALAGRLAQLQVPVRFGMEVPAARASSNHAAGGRLIVDCSGLAAREVLTDLRGVKGEMLLLRLHELSLSRPIRLLHPRIPLYVVPRGEGLFMVGATSIESDQPTRISARSMLELLSAAYALHPAFGEAEVVEIGTGVRPAFADNLPRIVWRHGTLYVNGLYRHGFLLAPALARMTADVVLRGASPMEAMSDADSRQRRLA